MAPKIYKSHIPAISNIPSESIFTHLFSTGRVASPTSSQDPASSADLVGGFPGSQSAFTDAVSGTTITRGQLKELALSVAYGLKNLNNVKLSRGDVVMIFSPNGLAWPPILFGSIAAGLRTTLANSGYTSKELAWQWKDSGAKLVFVAEDLVGVALEMLESIGLSKEAARERVLVIGSDLSWAKTASHNHGYDKHGFRKWESLLGQGRLTQEEKYDSEELANETVILCYSSGTTGKPKGVETTHKNLVSVLNMINPLFPPFGPSDSWIAILPMYHIYGCVKLLIFTLLNGVPVALMTKFEPEAFCANVERYKVTLALVVPPVLVALARHPAVEKYDMSTLQVAISGAAPLGAGLVKKVQDRLNGLRSNKYEPLIITQGYGLTETSPTTHLLPRADGHRKIGSIGLLLPNLEAKLVVDGEGDGLEDAKEGEPAELWIRGPSIMKGYLNNPVANADSLTHDRWFKTGDIAIRDREGFYYIVDRRKELIKYKGFQVPPAELEATLLTHPDIADVAVIGVEDHVEATELPRAYVVHASPSSLRSKLDADKFGQGVCKWMEGQVARHKFLRGGVVVIEVIPKSAAGKILRRELRELAKKDGPPPPMAKL